MHSLLDIIGEQMTPEDIASATAKFAEVKTLARSREEFDSVAQLQEILVHSINASTQALSASGAQVPSKEGGGDWSLVLAHPFTLINFGLHLLSAVVSCFFWYKWRAAVRASLADNVLLTGHRRSGAFYWKRSADQLNTSSGWSSSGSTSKVKGSANSTVPKGRVAASSTVPKVSGSGEPVVSGEGVGLFYTGL